MKKVGLFKKYEVKKISNPEKVVDGIVLEFDDALSRIGILAFAEACDNAGYELLANDLYKKIKAAEIIELQREFIRIAALLHLKGSPAISDADYDTLSKTFGANK